MEEILSLPPFLPFLIAGVFYPFLPLYGRRALLIIAPLSALFAILGLTTDGVFPVSLFGWEVQFLALQPYSLLFGLGFVGGAFAFSLYGMKTARKDEMAASLLLAAGGIGVVFAGDLLALVLFWELLLFASLYLIFNGGMRHSHASARRYLVMHVFGSACLLAGVAGLVVDSGITAFPIARLEFVLPSNPSEWAQWLMLIGVLVNVACLPFSAWLPDSYPNASVFGMLPLSMFTTKAAVFVLMLLFPGAPVLMPLGLVTLFYGSVMAMCSTDIRRIIAYTMVAQMGLMTLGIGAGNEMALSGVGLLVLAHIGYNGLLVATSGYMIAQTGKHSIHQTGGLWRYMPFSGAMLLLAAACMAAMPFTGVYVAKQMLKSGVAALEQPLLGIIILVSGLIATYALLPWFLLSGKRKWPEHVREAPAEIIAAYCVLLLLAFTPLLLPLGLFPFPWVSTSFLALAEVPALFEQLVIIVTGLVLFFLLLPSLNTLSGVVADVDIVYRKWLPYVFLLLGKLKEQAEMLGQQWQEQAGRWMGCQLKPLFGPQGAWVRPQSLGFSLLLLVVLLLVVLLYQLFLK